MKSFAVFFLALALVACSNDETGTQSEADLSTQVPEAPAGDSENIKQKNAPANRSYGAVYSPAVNSTVSGELVIEGLASRHDVGIKKVSVILDEDIVGTAQYGLPAELPAKLDPGFKDPNAPNTGFTFTINTAELEEGEHTVAIKAFPGDGSRPFIFGSRQFTVKQASP